MNCTKTTLGWENANLFIFEKCLDEPPSTTYDARVKGAPTKPSTAALLSTWQGKIWSKNNKVLGYECSKKSLGLGMAILYDYKNE